MEPQNDIRSACAMCGFLFSHPEVDGRWLCLACDGDPERAKEVEDHWKTMDLESKIEALHERLRLLESRRR